MTAATAAEPLLLQLIVPTQGPIEAAPRVAAALGGPLTAAEARHLAVWARQPAELPRIGTRLLHRNGRSWGGLLTTGSGDTLRVLLAPESPGLPEPGPGMLQNLMNALPINIFLKDSEGRLLFVNTATCETVGRSFDELLGHTDADFFTQETAARLRADDARALSQPSAVYTTEEVLEGAMGRRVMLAGKCALPTGDPEDPALLLGYSLDITDRKRLESELERRRNFLQDIVDADTNFIGVRRPDGYFLLVNRALASQMPATGTDPEGRHVRDLYPDASAAEDCLLADRLALETGRAQQREESFPTPSGTLRWLQTTRLPLQGPGGEALLLSISVDITERRAHLEAIKEARDAAEAASRAKTEFLATVSHEIRTPMNGVVGMSALLLDTKLSSEQHRYARTIRRSAEALLDIINDVLDFSKIEAGRLELDPSPFRPRDLVRSVVDLMMPRARGKGIALVHAVGPALPAWVEGDEGRVRQVLVNLIGNALKFTESGMVEVRLTGEPGHLRVEVQDTGPGIPQADHELVFEAFHQQRRGGGREGGTGLGLAICQRLCRVMGGELGLRSEPGHGSTFWFRVPVQPVSPDRIAPALPPEFRGVRVLSICLPPHQDATLIDAWGATVQVERTPAAGLHHLLMSVAQGPRPDLVLLAGAAVATLPAVLHALVGPLEQVGLVVIIDADREEELRIRAEVGARGTVVHEGDGVGALSTAIESVLRSQQPPLLDVDGRPSRVLVVEDNPVNQDVARLMLARAGYRVDLVDCGEDALDAVQRQTYGVLLMDVQMPGIGGIEATRRIRAMRSAAARVPIVAMTASVTLEFRTACREAGMNDFVSKPVVRQQLLRAVRRAIAGPNHAWDGPVSWRRSPVEVAVPQGPQRALAPLLDMTEVAELTADLGPEGVRMLVETMQRDAPPRCIRIVRDLEQNDTEAARREAHSLRAAAQVLGMSRLADQLSAVEKAGRAQDGPAAREAAQGLPDTLAQTLRLAQSHLD